MQSAELRCTFELRCLGGDMVIFKRYTRDQTTAPSIAQNICLGYPGSLRSWSNSYMGPHTSHSTVSFPHWYVCVYVSVVSPTQSPQSTHSTHCTCTRLGTLPSGMLGASGQPQLSQSPPQAPRLTSGRPARTAPNRGEVQGDNHRRDGGMGDG